MEHRPLNERHQNLRRDLYVRMHGGISDDEVSQPVAEVTRRTGIKPPDWFNSEGTTLSDVALITATARGGTQ